MLFSSSYKKKLASHLVYQTIWTFNHGKKSLAQSKEMKLNSAGPKSLNIFSCVVFSGRGQSLTCGRETGHWALLQTNLEILLIFPGIPRYQVLSCSRTREATRIQNLLYQISSFTLLMANKTNIKMWNCFYYFCHCVFFY